MWGNMKNFKTFLTEYISNPLIWFRDFLESSNYEKAEYMAREFGDHYFDEYLEFNGLDPATEFNDEDTELMIAYGSYIMFQGYHHKHIPEEEKPSWEYLSEPTIVRNSWLIHQTDHVRSILKEGFQYGLEDYTKLGLTSWFSLERKKRYKDEDIYLFSFTPSNFHKYHKRNTYGKDLLMFTSSGVTCYHNGDEEYQTIFLADTARNFIPIWNTESNYIIENKVTGEVIFEDEDAEKCVDWVIKNFNQYKKKIVERETNNG